MLFSSKVDNERAVADMYDFTISTEQARQFACACYDAIVRNIELENRKEDSDNTGRQKASA